MTEVSRAEYARLRGVSRAAITQAIKKGKLHLTPGGNIDVAAANSELARTSGHHQQTAAASAARRRESLAAESIPAAPRGVDYMQVRTLRESYLARLAKLDYESRSGQLIPYDQVREDAFKHARVARDRILGIADRLGAILAAESDPVRVREILLAEAKSVCDDLSHGLTDNFGPQ